MKEHHTIVKKCLPSSVVVSNVAGGLWRCALG